MASRHYASMVLRERAIAAKVAGQVDESVSLLRQAKEAADGCDVCLERIELVGEAYGIGAPA